MRTLQAEYPVQKRRALFSRLCKYAVLKALCTRWVFGGIIGTYRRLGWEYDRMVNGRVRGFAGAEFFQMIRQQPSAPLLALLERRLARYPAERLGRRGAKGRELLRRLSPVVPCPSAALVPHSHWVFAILPDDPQEAIAALSRAGFDATQGQSMRVVDPPADRPHLAATASLDIMQRLVFIPIYPEMTDRALARMADVLIGLAAEATGPRPAAPQRRSEGVKVSAPHAASGVAGRLRLGRPQP
jgi:dTDP-4-amino-4,6-dideoxygalactose transaminase